MQVTHLELTCPNGHRQIAALKGWPESTALAVAQLFNGTSASWLGEVNDQSPVGRCCACGAALTATVLGNEEKKRK